MIAGTTLYEVVRCLDYWGKIGRNRARDMETTALLEERGWLVLRFWAHEPRAAAVESLRVPVRDSQRLIAGRLSTQSSVIGWIGATRSPKSLCRAISAVRPNPKSQRPVGENRHAATTSKPSTG